ncbi:MAG: hypothetical protein ACOCZH_05350 [Phototrophicaceae bacterium]
MAVNLACAWHPRGEAARFQRFHGLLAAEYEHMTVSVPPHADAESVAALRTLAGVSVTVTDEWSHGRYVALREAADADYVHYVDGDRLLRWVETRPDEWRAAVRAVQRADCLVIGRTAAAWETHPQALRRTEHISNTVVSHLLGQPLDLSAGSKGFSRAVVAHLLANTRPGRALGADSEWIVIAHRAGFRVEQMLVDGLDWETADRFQSAAASDEAQRAAAARYDTESENWAMRVEVAAEIVSVGLEAWQRPLTHVDEMG